MDDVERAVDDGVNTFKAKCKDSRRVAGAGATEIELAHRLSLLARKETGLAQYAIAKFGTSLELFPRMLAENAGLNATEIVSQLYAAHAAGDSKAGINVDEGVVQDMTKESICDLYVTKYWGVKFALDAVLTVLRVDQIIMAKPAGGPKGPPQGPGDD